MIAAFLFAYGCCLAPCTIGNTDYKFDETYVRAPGRQWQRASVAGSFFGRFCILYFLFAQIWLLRGNCRSLRFASVGSG
jgi:hypothetical protein